MHTHKADPLLIHQEFVILALNRSRALMSSKGLLTSANFLITVDLGIADTARNRVVLWPMLFKKANCQGDGLNPSSEF